MDPLYHLNSANRIHRLQTPLLIRFPDMFYQRHDVESLQILIIEKKASNVYPELSQLFNFSVFFCVPCTCKFFVTRLSKGRRRAEKIKNHL